MQVQPTIKNTSSVSLGSNQSLFSNMPPNVTKGQLKEIILSKYTSQIKNPQTIEKIRQIIEDHFSSTKVVNTKVVQQIKVDIHNNVKIPPSYQSSPKSALDKKNKYRTPQTEKKSVVLPNINQSQMISKVKDERQEKEKIEEQKPQPSQNDKEKTVSKQIEKQEEKQENQGSLTDRIKANDKDNIQAQKQHQERLQKLLDGNSDLNVQIKQLQSNTRQLQTDINGNDSPRSVYKANQQDEWTLMTLQDSQRYHAEIEAKKMKIKENQKVIKKELDQQVKVKKYLRYKKNQENTNLENDLTLKEIDRFDKIENFKKLTKKQKIQLVEDVRKQQVTDTDQIRKKKALEEENTNQDIIDKAKKEYDEIQQRKKNKRIDEYNFYKKVREEDENYKQKLKNSNIFSNPHMKMYQKNYNNISNDYSTVYRKRPNQDPYPGLNQHFEKNKQAREQLVQDRYQRIENLVTPLSKSFKIPDPEKDREDEKQYYQQKFKKDEDLIEQEKLKLFEKKMRYRSEIVTDLDVQVGEIQQRKKDYVQFKREQATLWQHDTDNYNQIQSVKNERKKKEYQDLQLFLSKQIEENKIKKKNITMSDEELLMNKKNLKQIMGEANTFGQNGYNTFDKVNTVSYRHIKQY